MHREALLSLLDATFYGDGTIEILGGDLDCHRMEMNGIDLQYSETRVTLVTMGAGQRLM